MIHKIEFDDDGFVRSIEFETDYTTKREAAQWLILVMTQRVDRGKALKMLEEMDKEPSHG